MPIEYDAPDNHIGEISIFGPGIGECIVLHIGQGRWFVIDSCLCPKTKQPIALQYFKDIGVDASTQVVGILISHWHSDHIQGATSEFLITRDPRSNKRVKRDSMVERELRAIVKERKTINDKMGHIQIRISEKGLLEIRTNETVVRFPGTVE